MKTLAGLSFILVPIALYFGWQLWHWSYFWETVVPFVAVVALLILLGLGTMDDNSAPSSGATGFGLGYLARGFGGGSDSNSGYKGSPSEFRNTENGGGEGGG